MIPIKRTELHTALFLGGKNHGLKIEAKAGLSLVYDRAEKELLIEFNGEKAILPSSNVATMVEMSSQAKMTAGSRPPMIMGKIKAQVSTPQDHVFSDGPGKTHD